MVGVKVIVGVGVDVRVGVIVTVGVLVGVNVAVDVGVDVAVWVIVGVGVGTANKVIGVLQPATRNNPAVIVKNPHWNPRRNDLVSEAATFKTFSPMLFSHSIAKHGIEQQGNQPTSVMPIRLRLMGSRIVCVYNFS